jgi:hypothetical protein
MPLKERSHPAALEWSGERQAGVENAERGPQMNANHLIIAVGTVLILVFVIFSVLPLFDV